MESSDNDIDPRLEQDKQMPEAPVENQAPELDGRASEQLDRDDALQDEIRAAIAYLQLSTALSSEPQQPGIWRRLYGAARKIRKARWVATAVIVLFGLGLILGLRTNLEARANAAAVVQTVTPIPTQPLAGSSGGELATAPTPLAPSPTPLAPPLMAVDTATPEPMATAILLPSPTPTTNATLAPLPTFVPTPLPPAQGPQKEQASSSSSTTVSSLPPAPTSAPAPASAPSAAPPPPPSGEDDHSGSDSGGEKGNGNGKGHGNGNSNGSNGGGSKGKED